jgi:hypothetical protein
MTRRILVVLALLSGAIPAAAQTPASPPRVEFMPRAVFHLTAEHLWGEPDRRFRWDTNFGGEMDVVDYGVGRLTFVANYQAILGDEFQVFDPNQGNYVLDGSLSARLPQVELAGVFYHQSRHLGDRRKEFPVDWNMVGVRALRTFPAGAFHVATRADLRGSIKQSFIDYTWEFDGRVRADRLVRPGVGVLLSGSVRHLGVDGSANRGGQTGYRGEAGVRLEGSGGAVELFVAAERRIDPYPTEFSTATWVAAGFRLLTR